MMSSIRAAVALGAFAAAFCFTAPAFADGAPRTVSEYYDAMETSATRLDAEVAERQKIGDMSAVQRIALVAAMVRRAAGEFRGAEQEFMLDPVSELAGPIPARADEALAKSKAAELAAAEHDAFIDEAQLTFNALLAALPLQTPHPIVYGMLVNDLENPATPLPSDVVFYGFRLIDPVYKVAPTVLYGRTEFPASSLTVKDDRIQAQLPQAVKDAVHYAPTPCESRAGFALRVHLVYAQRHGFWPIAWHTQSESNMDFFGYPTPIVYSASLTTSSQGSTSTSTVENFDKRSSVVNADCEQTKAADVSFPLPAGATDAECKSSWVDATGATKISLHCDIVGQQARATGAITAGPKVCSPDKLCTCSIPAQGWLELRGSYRRQETTTVTKTDAGVAHVDFAAGGVAIQKIPLAEDRKLRHVAMAISRRACGTVVDTIDLNIGDDPNAEALGVSASGEFRASIRGVDLKVGAAFSFAPDARNAP